MRRTIWRVLWIPAIVGFVTATHLAPAEETVAQPKVILGGNTQTNTPTGSTSAATQGVTAVSSRLDPNVLVTEAVADMPASGGYRANSVAMVALRRSIQLGDSQLAINPDEARPSFCSGATYLIFLKVLNRLNHEGAIHLNDATFRALLVQEDQADGVGAWGRWNANGPGTARLFYETGMGVNFTSLADARPGDFLKIFWNDEIGARESGHSVIYLGSETKAGGEYVRYWSSNVPSGFGVAEVPHQRIHRMLFSRLVRPDLVPQITTLPARDPYLASMLKRSSSADEMQRMVGIGPSHGDSWFKRLLHLKSEPKNPAGVNQ